MCIDRALRGQSLSGAKGVSGKTLYSRAGFPCAETNDLQGNPKNCPNYSTTSTGEKAVFFGLFRNRKPQESR